jgi:hypothetical protein
MPKAATRYKPGSYKAPEPKEIDVEGVGSFLVKPLSNREQEQIQKDTPKADGQSEEEHNQAVSYAYISLCLVEPAMSVEQIREDAGAWTVRQGGEFVGKVLRAAQVVDDEDLDAVRRRFHPEDDG